MKTFQKRSKKVEVVCIKSIAYGEENETKMELFDHRPEWLIKAISFGHLTMTRKEVSSEIFKSQYAGFSSPSDPFTVVTMEWKVAGKSPIGVSGDYIVYDVESGSLSIVSSRDFFREYEEFKK